MTIHDNSNRIPTNCDLAQTTEKTCSKFFHEVEKSYGETSTADKQAVRNKFCTFPWNMFGLGSFSYIVCEENTPGYIKNDCQNICNPESIGNDTILE